MQGAALRAGQGRKAAARAAWAPISSQGLAPKRRATLSTAASTSGEPLSSNQPFSTPTFSGRRSAVRPGKVGSA